MIGDLPGNIQTGRVASCKSFPRNVEFEFEYAVNRPGEPTEPGTTASRDHDTIALSVSLGLLPDQAMPGRIKDDRIGFFTSKCKGRREKREEKREKRERNIGERKMGLDEAIERSSRGSSRG